MPGLPAWPVLPGGKPAPADGPGKEQRRRK